MRGAKVFAHLWFPLLYAALVAVTAALWFVGPELVFGWRRLLLACVSAMLAVFVASLLTRMRLQYLSAIETLEGTGGA